jgi:hypothetical protein
MSLMYYVWCLHLPARCGSNPDRDHGRIVERNTNLRRCRYRWHFVIDYTFKAPKQRKCLCCEETRREAEFGSLCLQVSAARYRNIHDR